MLRLGTVLPELDVLLTFNSYHGALSHAQLALLQQIR